MVWVAENSIDKRGLEIAITTMFIRFMMLDKHLPPKVNRLAKRDIKSILNNHQESIKLEKKLNIGYTGSYDYYYALIVERAFDDINLRS